MSRSHGASSFLPIILLVIGLIIGGGGVYYFIFDTYQQKINENELEIEDLLSQISSLAAENLNFQNEVLGYTSELSEAKTEISSLESQVARALVCPDIHEM
jgi:F0F1-type ATP synthase membrane subunit b/b'